jgi:hypothetical protein
MFGAAKEIRNKCKSGANLLSYWPLTHTSTVQQDSQRIDHGIPFNAEYNST